MSSHKIRKDKTCLNCNAIVHSKYCSECGQINTDPNISLKELLHDFLHDLTHFDGKFFATSKLLIFKPGYLSTEFMRGRRASYLHPVRLYVFTSAIFFYLFFNIFVHVEQDAMTTIKELTPMQMVQKLNEYDTSKSNQLRLEQSFVIRSKQDTLFDLGKKEMLEKISDSIATLESNKAASSLSLSFSDKPESQNDRYKTVETYLHFQDSIPKAKRDGFFKSYTLVRGIKLKQFFEEYKEKAILKILDKFIHSFTSMMFLSLPFIAMILSLLFYKRTDHSYVGNGIYLLHLYVFTFFVTLLILISVKVAGSLNFSFSGLLNVLLVLLIIFYGYKSMKNYYNLKRTTAIFKYIIFLLFSFIIMMSLFIINFFITLFQL